MQRLSEKHSVSQTLRALRFLAIRCRSRPQTRDLIPELQATRTALTAADEAWKQAREERVAQTAEVEYLDRLVDENVMSIARVQKSVVEGKLDSPAYIRMFPVPPSEATKGVGGDKQDHFVTNLVDIIQKSDEHEHLRPRAEALSASQAELTASITIRNGLHRAEGTASIERRIAADAAKRAYNHAFPKLTLLFGDDRTLVESFFAKLTKDTAAEAPPSIAVPDGAPN